MSLRAIFSACRNSVTHLFHTHFHVRRHFVRLPPLLSSVARQQNLTEYWREGSTSTAISTIFASDVVGQHNKIGGINFGAALVNVNSNQNYFQFHGSYYKYEKREPLGLPISRSIFKNFLQNLEGKFIKSSSKSRALIRYPTGCPRRHCTPNLLIYFILPALYGSGRSLWEPSWSSQIFMHHHILYDLFHEIYGVQEMQVTVTMAHNTELVHTLLSGVLKLGLHGNHGSGKGDVAQPQPIHWPVNDLLRNSHTVRVKRTGALSCWYDTCYIIPLLLGSGIT